MKAGFLALTAIVLWSTAATAFKISLRYMTPYQLVLMSSAVSLAALSLIRLSSRAFRGTGVAQQIKNQPSNSHSIGASALRGFLNPFLYYMVLLEAYDRLPAQIAMVINYLWPIVLVLLAIPVMKQRAGPWTLAATAVCFAGVVVLVLGGGSIDGGASLPAIGLALISTVIWATFWLLNLRSSEEPVKSLQAGFAFGLLYLLVYGISMGRMGALTALPWQAFAGAVWVGLFEMGIAFVVWLRALSLAETTADVGSLVYLTPFLSLLFIGAAAGESITLWTLGGLLLVTAGIAVQKLKGHVKAGQ